MQKRTKWQRIRKQIEPFHIQAMAVQSINKDVAVYR